MLLLNEKVKDTKSNSSEQSTTDPASYTNLVMFTFGAKDSKMKLSENRNCIFKILMESEIYSLEKIMAFTSNKKLKMCTPGVIQHMDKPVTIMENAYT